MRDVVLKHLDTARNEKLIGAPLEARVRLTASPELYRLLERYAAELPALFIVSQVVVQSGGTGEPLRVNVEKADGAKCERCWNYSPQVGQSTKYATVCERCVEALDQMGY